MAVIHNIRKGFATNSSSSHSVVLAPGISDDPCCGDFEFGWEDFVLANSESKMRYLHFACVEHYEKTASLSRADAQALAERYFPCGITLKDGEGYIDHQSNPSFPNARLQSQGMGPLWGLMRREIVEDGDVAILGGNDNQDNDAWKPNVAQGAPRVSAYYDMIHEEGSSTGRYYLYDEAHGHFVTYNRSSGTKIRFSEKGKPAPTVASAPELVDIKLTDYCPVGCHYCVDPETPVLKADFTWTRIGDIQEGERIVAFDEFPTTGNKQRRLRGAIVEKKWTVKKDAVRITTEFGSVVCSTEHRFLITHNGGRWMKASNLRLGHTIAFGEAPWSSAQANPVSRDYMVGYLAGMTQGDGTARWEPLEGATTDPKDSRRQVWWRVALKDHDGLQRVVDYLDALGIQNHGIKPFVGNKETERSPMEKVELRSRKTLDQLRSTLASADATSPDYAKGFLAGGFDAEGSYSDGVLRISQIQPNNFLDKITSYLAMLRVDSIREPRGVRITGGVWTAMRFFGIVGPAIKRKTVGWSVISAHHRGAKITALESLGEQELVDIQTTARTFYANGFASHNCYQGSTVKGKHADKGQVESFIYNLGRMGVFEVAIGGGDPTTHPDFASFLRSFRHQGIVPNFSTQMWDWLDKPEILEAVQENCGAVALSTQDPELARKWLKRTKEVGIRGHVHYVLGLSPLQNLKALLKDKEGGYLVLLGYKAMGRAEGKAPIDYKGWQDVIRKAKGSGGFGFPWTIAVDSFLTDDVASGFTREEVPAVLYEKSDGCFSMYWDAVDGEYAAHSFVPKADRIKGGPYEMERAWQKISGCKSVQTEAD